MKCMRTKILFCSRKFIPTTLLFNLYTHNITCIYLVQFRSYPSCGCDLQRVSQEHVAILKYYTPPGPMRYTLRTTASSQTVRSSQSISPSSPVSSQRIYFPTSSQRTHRVTPMLTPGITSLLQGPDSRTPPAYRNPIGHNVAKSGNRWTQQVYSQNTHLRNPLQITPTRGITSKLH